MDTETKKIRSDKDSHEWYPLCPCQVRKNTVYETDGGVFLTVATAVLTAGHIDEIHVTIEPIDARRQPLDTLTAVLAPENSAPIPLPDGTMYVHTTIEAVYSGGKAIWERGDRLLAKLPEQAMLWQTDPLYAQLRRECEGIVEPIYQPDAIDGGWRCTCGQVNLDDRADCCRCHGNRAWLEAHFDRDYLAEKNAAFVELEKKAPGKKVNYRNDKDRADRRKMIAILASFAAAIVLIICTFTLIVPSVRYSKADAALSTGDFDAAITGFTELGSFRDAAARASDATYQKARAMTGLDEVYLVTTAECPWFSITEDGVLSLRKDDYKGSWEEFVVPDLVDGIIVRELDRNFFLNCKELQTVVLSDCIEVLGEQTFYNCDALTEIHFGKNLKTIAPRAFINCVSLESITIPDSVEKIGLRAFNSCTALTSVTLGRGITEIPSYLFSCCYKLRRVNCLGVITTVGDFAFSECPALEKIYIPADCDWSTVAVGSDNDDLSHAEIVAEE